MTKQEIFDKVAIHLFAQDEQAFDPKLAKDTCVLLTESGLMCVIGYLVQDLPEMFRLNQFTLSIGIEKYPDLFENGKQKPLIYDLREAHDNSDNWLSTDTMQKALMTVAKDHQLSADILSTLSFKDR